MSCNWMRRALLALASVSLLSLVACGSGTIESQFHPTRMVVMGDGLSDIGQTGPRYTVNDGTSNIWTQVVAASFGLTIATQSAGGTSFATINARISAQPDAAGSSANRTVTQQVDAYLAAGAPGANDLVIINAGVSDIIFEMAQFRAGTQTSDQMVADVQQAGRDLAAQVRRLVSAGATHVVVMGTYDLGRSPWSTAISQSTLLGTASTKFNESLLVSIVDLGNNVLYIDSAFLFNLMTAVPSSYGMANAIDPVCTTVDGGAGIGIGAGEINSALCTALTVLTTANYNTYVFADKVYFTPNAHTKLGEYAFARIRARW